MQRIQVCDVAAAGRMLSVSTELQEVRMLLSSDHPVLTASWRHRTVAQLTIGTYSPLPSTSSMSPTTLLSRVFSDAPERVDIGRFFIEVLQSAVDGLRVMAPVGLNARIEVGRLRELTVHRSVLDSHAFACLFSALPYTRTLEALCMEEPNATRPWELPKLECAWLAYAIFHPSAATSSWRRLELRNCDPFCIDEILDLPPDRKVEILSATRLSRLQRNKKRKQADLRAPANNPHLPQPEQASAAIPMPYEGESLTPRVACIRENTAIHALSDATATCLLVLTKQKWLEACHLQTQQWLCVLVPGFGLGWVRRDAVEATKRWTPGARHDQPSSTLPLAPSLTSLKLKGECLNMARTKSLVRALGSSLESLELQTSRMNSYLLKDIAKSCPRLRALQIKTKFLKLKGSALREFFSDTAVARRLRSLTLNWGICNPRVLLDLLSNSHQYPVANVLEELHLCYVPPLDYLNRHRDFVSMLQQNLVLERMYLSGGAQFEQLVMLRGFSGEVVAYEKTVRERLAFLSVVAANQQRSELSTSQSLTRGRELVTRAPPARPSVFRNLSVDLMKLIFAFGVTQRVVGSWPPVSS